ncbi:MAG: YbaK/EbsC family protein [Gammaproteobacteria bacterium]|jgi:prolyl-tRNA editing enzyme YbaK/EbsC (Cys-tRNA(Pro) deacylase)
MSQNNPVVAPALETPALHSLQTPEAAATIHPALGRIAEWVRDYLCQPHPELGRNGPVCPFVPGALQKKMLFGTLYEGEHLNKEAVKAILLDEMERFINLQPTSGNEAQFKSLMVLFPGMPAGQAREIIDAAQIELQKHFVPNGLMVGEFHAGPPQKGGLWNTKFRPLHSPVPMLVIRHMVPTDILFLKDHPDLFFGYLKIYGNAVPERFRPQFEEAAARFGVEIKDPGEHPYGAPQIIETLDSHSLDYRVHCHDDFEQSIRTPADFARALGYPENRITKTLFLRSHKSLQYLLLVAPIDKRVDLRHAAEILDTGRLELASLEELQRHVGYPPTSVTPIAVHGVRVVLDDALLAHPTILTGSGVPRVEIEIAPAELATVCAAQIVALP